jgi:cell division septum initiation protein DivIVA
MSDFDQTSVELEQRTRRPSASRFTDRLARTFGSFDRTQAELPGWENTGDVEYPIGGEPGVPWDVEHDRFPVARHGYDRAAVDRHVAELERELAVLRDSGPGAQAISAEIERFGEQTATILKVAHEQAFQTKRGAQAEADRCLADAAANALAITDEAQQRLRRLDSDTDQIWQERARLIEDVRTVATALISLAEDAVGRFPPEQERPEQATRALPQTLSAGNGSDDDSFTGLA